MKPLSVRARINIVSLLPVLLAGVLIIAFSGIMSRISIMRSFQAEHTSIALLQAQMIAAEAANSDLSKAGKAAVWYLNFRPEIRAVTVTDLGGQPIWSSARQRDESVKTIAATMFPVDQQVYTAVEGDRLHVAARIAADGGIGLGLLQASISTEPVYKEVYANLAGLLGAIVATTAVGFMLAIWLKGHLTNAIGDLVSATRKIGRGVRGIHIPRHDEGELGELATAIEWMARQLQSHEDELRQAQAASKPAPHAKMPSMAPGKGTRSTYGVLTGAQVVVVEDAPNTQRVLRLMLEREGALVKTLSNGQEAVDFLGSYHLPCVVLMDVQMPVLDGFAATQQLRQMGFASPIIAVTAQASREDRERCLDAGCNDFLPKPIRRDELIQLLSGWVAHTVAGQDVDGEVSAEELAVAMSA